MCHERLQTCKPVETERDREIDTIDHDKRKTTKITAHKNEMAPPMRMGPTVTLLDGSSDAVTVDADMFEGEEAP